VGLCELLQRLLNWKLAFAVLAAGATIFSAKPYGHLKSDVEIWIGLFTAVGFWLLVAFAGVRIRHRIAARMRARRLALRRAAAAEAKQAAEKVAAELAVERAIKNLRELHRREYDALNWIYHHGGRKRVSVQCPAIEGLSTMGLLVPEGRPVTDADCIWLIPERIMAKVKDRIGPPNSEKATRNPPWD
jgi:hypothetical protein